jgi:dihydroorotate dehydrogenase (NAD+) catalytic subunit
MDFHMTELSRDSTPPSDGRLLTRIGRLTLPNPVMPASGCFGPELDQLIPTGRLGAVVTKTVFADVRSGNPAHRLTETPRGMLNAVGIPSPGSEAFLARVLPAYRALGAKVVVSIGGLSVDDYLRIADALAETDCDAFEINLSCPNLEHDGLAMGAAPQQVETVTRGVVERVSQPVLVKLTPNVTQIDDIARAAEDGGATAVTVANTFVGMAIDVRRRRAVLGNGTGGASGPAIKPLALRLVRQASSAVSIPVVGCGGIATTMDAIEFIMAGATAVQVGTATFAHPETMTTIIETLPALLDELGAATVAELVGAADVPSHQSVETDVQLLATQQHPRSPAGAI